MLSTEATVVTSIQEPDMLSTQATVVTSIQEPDMLSTQATVVTSIQEPDMLSTQATVVTSRQEPATIVEYKSNVPQTYIGVVLLFIPFHGAGFRYGGKEEIGDELTVATLHTLYNVLTQCVAVLLQEILHIV